VALAGGATLSVTSPAKANVWSHVAGVFDGTRIKLYVNATLVASRVAAGTLQQSAQPLHIGGWPSWNAYLGEIDEAWLGGVALSAQQVQVLARRTTSFGYDWPNAVSSSNSDPWLVTNHDEICELKPRILALNFVNDPSGANFSTNVNEVIAGLTEGSRYHGYGDPNALPALRPEVFKAVDLSDATPVPGWNHKNSSKFPLKCLGGGDYKFKYSQLFDPQFTSYYNVPDPAVPGANLGLCDLVTRGQVQEVWLFIDGDSDAVTCPNGVTYSDFQPLESVESKQVYTSNGSKVPGSFDSCAGNGCLDGQDEPAFVACGKSLKVVYVNSTRGPGCAIHSLGHSFESIARAGGSVPALGTEFLHFGNFDLNLRFPVGFQSWYGIIGDPTSGITFTGTNALTWSAYSGAFHGVMNPYDQGCGNVHFAPNSREHYDDQNTQSVFSTCEHYGLHDGPAGKDIKVLYNKSKSDLYNGLAPDCGGGWQVYWRQSFPGVNNPAWTATGNKMKNWWPYLYY
jgi:hypothetical protein